MFFGLPTVSDKCGIATIVQTGGDLSGSIFPLGVSTITYTVTDVNGNGDDDLTVDFSNENPVPKGGIFFKGGMQQTSYGDALSIFRNFNTQIITHQPPGIDGNNSALTNIRALLDVFEIKSDIKSALTNKIQSKNY